MLDQFLRAEAIIALMEFRRQSGEVLTESHSAVIATLKQWSPECPWSDFAVLAAAVYLGECDHPDAAPTLLAAFREVKAACLRELPEWNSESGRDWATTPKARITLLVTLAEALSHHVSPAGRVEGELVSAIPIMQWPHVFDHRQPFQTRVRPRQKDTPYSQPHESFCPDPRVAWWRVVDTDWQTAWSPTKMLERVGPPAKEDVPKLQALLDYDGEGVTGESKLIEGVRQEAARALLRDATAGVKDRRAVLERVSTDAASHPRLAGEAKAQLQQLPKPTQ